MSRGGLISPGAVFIISCCGAKPINNHYICQNGSGFIVAKAGLNQEEEGEGGWGATWGLPQLSLSIQGTF